MADQTIHNEAALRPVLDEITFAPSWLGLADRNIARRELIVRHELMEAFLYKGIRIFDPHRTVEELSLPELMEKESPL